VDYKLAWLALMGALGTLCRYGLDGAVLNVCGTRFPWGILAVNSLGCFLFGLIWSLAEERLMIGGETRSLVLIGFMGAFTTFSTFTFDTLKFLQASQWGLAVANSLGQMALGLLLLFLGLKIGSLL
jgi:fluoride exporter